MFQYNQAVISSILTKAIWQILFQILHKMNDSNQKDTFIFVILGSSAMKDSQPINQRNVIKYGNYSLSSYSILIKRLATNYLGIDKRHICIFAKGESKRF